MRILIIGNPDYIYIYNYIKYVLLDLNIKQLKIYIFSFNNLQNSNSKFHEFYKENRIVVIEPKQINRMIQRIPKLRGLINLINSNLSFAKIIKLYHYFDVLHIHYVDPGFSTVLKRYEKHFGKIITTFWGSDLFRSKDRDRKKINNILSSSSSITVATNVMEQFIYVKFGSGYRHKIKQAMFGLSVLECIKTLENDESIEQAKLILRIPRDKVIITCGYNANRAQQHILIINALKKCSKELRDQVYLIFPLAYPVNPEYITELEKYLSNSGLVYSLNTKFLNEFDTARLRRVSDILIHAQKTDAFSGSVQEHIYANNIVFNGSWLEYPILDKEHIYYKEFNDEADLTAKLIDTIHNLSKEKEKVRENSGLIYNISSWKHVKHQWQSLYLMQ